MEDPKYVHRSIHCQLGNCFDRKVYMLTCGYSVYIILWFAVRNHFHTVNRKDPGTKNTWAVLGNC